MPLGSATSCGENKIHFRSSHPVARSNHARGCSRNSRNSTGETWVLFCVVEALDGRPAGKTVATTTTGGSIKRFEERLADATPMLSRACASLTRGGSRGCYRSRRMCILCIQCHCRPLMPVELPCPRGWLPHSYRGSLTSPGGEMSCPQTSQRSVIPRERPG